MRVVCPGSFDPITLGHVDVIQRAAEIFGEVVVAVGVNTTKQYVFSEDERIALARRTFADLPGVIVAPIEGLLVDFCREHGAEIVVKGLRFSSDFEFELQQAHMNNHVGDVETVFLPASREFGTISSTLIRNIAAYGGDVSAFLPPEVNEALMRRMAERRG
ncbi:pantetheine-phosphate adenylyltransferase [Aestuariimicrobium ganziense]|uniref:pantetheine-phosphate adenylyltransferase n=1 Tax=Aestuariimicrobium ganziense TaxID=2773677 RepID=UPI001944BBE6|nr:pantetheine-phosphate adenylyltransferase [Aestuariimicrobium ganziense]